MKPPRMPDLSAGACTGRIDEFRDITTRTAPRAVEVCKSGCPVLQVCAEWGLRHERHGVWGGMSYRALAYKRRQLGIRLEEVQLTSRAIAPRPTATQSAIGAAA